jgi:hypothetical protein
MSAAGAALQMSGSGLSLMNEVADETDAERRRRILAQQQQTRASPYSAAGQALSATGYASVLG